MQKDTKVKMHELACPQCGNVQEVEIWNSLNVTSYPMLHTRLFNADINIFKCESCDHKAIISVPLLYIDMNRQYYVKYYPQMMTFLPSSLLEANGASETSLR